MTDPKDALIAQMAAALRDCLPQITVTNNGAYCNGCCRGADNPEAIKHKASCDYVTISELLASDAAQEAMAERQRLLDWKESAMQVMAEWDLAWEAAGKPGALGSSKAGSTTEWIRKAQAEREELLRDMRRLDILQAEMLAEPILLHNLATLDGLGRPRGLGLCGGRRTLRQAIDEACPGEGGR
jgi:hypothetical protein